MTNHSIPHDARIAIARAMTKTQRHAWKEGVPVKVTIQRSGRPLKRWGEDGNKCVLTLRKNTIVENNLIDLAWSNDKVLASAEAQTAINYFVHGEKDEYEISIQI